jgi:hypothetical protein
MVSIGLPSRDRACQAGEEAGDVDHVEGHEQQHRLQAGLAAGRHAQQGVADIGDRAVGPQALEVVLRQAREGADEDREQRR